jgi:hypothetical protein
LPESFNDWLYGEGSEQFRAGGSLSQCLKKGICNVWEIREDAANRCQYRQFQSIKFSVIDYVWKSDIFAPQKL